MIVLTHFLEVYWAKTEDGFEVFLPILDDNSF